MYIFVLYTAVLLGRFVTLVLLQSIAESPRYISAPLHHEPTGYPYIGPLNTFSLTATETQKCRHPTYPRRLSRKLARASRDERPVHRSVSVASHSYRIVFRIPLIRFLKRCVGEGRSHNEAVLEQRATRSLSRRRIY